MNASPANRSRKPSTVTDAEKLKIMRAALMEIRGRAFKEPSAAKIAEGALIRAGDDITPTGS